VEVVVPGYPAASANPPGLDLAQVAGYLTRVLLAEPASLSGALIGGGKSNLTYRITDGQSEVVLRRPPLGHVLPSAHDMVREFRVISALSPAGFPVPTPLLLCEDPDVIGAPFYLMSYVDGVVLRTARDYEGLSPEIARRCGELLVDLLLDLHRIDHVAVGLTDFGRPQGYLQRQVTRWHQQWQRSQTRELPQLEHVTEALLRSVPVPAAAGIVHGDFRLDNVVLDHALIGIMAVLDWEMATIGDPLADVGLLVAYTELAADGMSLTTARLGPDQGFLSATEVAERYAKGSAIPLDRLDWYVALAYYKLAIIGEGIHARYLQGKTVGEGFETMGSLIPQLIERAFAALPRD
jgi:aminoglycoside phosphotransferase (APT) family kinase protein